MDYLFYSVVKGSRVARSSWYSRGPFYTRRLLKIQIKSDIEKLMPAVLDARQAKNAAILGLEIGVVVFAL
jgi:hypothetical protein